MSDGLPVKRSEMRAGPRRDIRHPFLTGRVTRQLLPECLKHENGTIIKPPVGRVRKHRDGNHFSLALGGEDRREKACATSARDQLGSVPSGTGTEGPLKHLRLDS